MTHTPPPTQDDLAAGRELDAEVATKIMRLRAYRRWPDDDYDSWYVVPTTAGTVPSWDEVEMPAYSTDVGAAWQIVEHMDSLGWKVQVRSDSQLESYEVDEPWVCVFAHRDGAPWAAANTAPLAIC